MNYCDPAGIFFSQLYLGIGKSSGSSRFDRAVIRLRGSRTTGGGVGSLGMIPSNRYNLASFFPVIIGSTSNLKFFGATTFGTFGRSPFPFIMNLQTRQAQLETPRIRREKITQASKLDKIYPEPKEKSLTR